MKEYTSKYNVMKRQEQRKRMSENNPMKNPEIAKKVNKQKRKPVIINGEFYESVLIATQKIGVSHDTIRKWCKQGYNNEGKPCRYADEEQKEIPEIKKLHPNAPRAKGVIIDDIYFYYTVLDAANQFFGGKYSSPLIKALKNNKTYKGHTCKYANQQPSQGNTK